MSSSSNTVGDIELQTNCEDAKLRMSQIERFSDNSGYTCILTVQSRGFACTRKFYFDDFHLANAVKALKAMDRGEPGEAIIKEMWEKDFIKFVSNQLGHVVLSGEMYEHSELSQSLRFAFRTDQTVLNPLVRGLTALQGA